MVAGMAGTAGPAITDRFGDETGVVIA